MEKYYPPAHKVSHFHCPYCHVYAAQGWIQLHYRSNGWLADEDLDVCACRHCNKRSYWYKSAMVIPVSVTAPSAHDDMPDDSLADYDEARGIVARSPRAAAALLRLALQKLMVDLGEGGKNVNDDIRSLVAKGLPVVVQQALDICRVVGNNAVHPGELSLQDTPEVATSLFDMLNFIVDDRIARPKTVTKLYASLPVSARQAIEKRDKPSEPNAKAF